MDALLRVVRGSPNVFKDKSKTKSKHAKIPEGWGENKEPVVEGVTFYLKYIGSTLVEEIESDQTYGDGISAKAVQNIIAMAKAAGKKLRKTALTVTPKGIIMVDMLTNQVMFDLSIYRISFCTADKTHDKVFAYIARNTTNETMECHAFLCAKTKIAQAVTLTVSQAFSIAQERWLENKKSKRFSKEKAQKEKVSNGQSSPSKPPSSPAMKTAVGTLISITPTDPEPPQFPVDEQTNQSRETQGDFRKNWENFDEEEGEDINDMFSQLAENRCKRIPSFGTDLKAEEVDDGVKKYMEGSACYEAFARTMSFEDLLNL